MRLLVSLVLLCSLLLCVGLKCFTSDTRANSLLLRDQKRDNLNIMSARFLINPKGSQGTIDISNSGELPVRLRKGEMRTLVSVSDVERIITFRIECVDYVLDGYQLTFSPSELNVVELQKNQYSEATVETEGFGGAKAPRFAVIQRALDRDYRVLVQYVIDQRNGELLGVWHGELLYDAESDIVFLEKKE